MKKIFWTTIFWIVVFFGFALYMKMFDANLATGVSTWLGTKSVDSTALTASGDALSTTGTEADLMTQITTIQTTLTDMQTKLDVLVGTPSTSVITPVVVSGTVKETLTGN